MVRVSMKTNNPVPGDARRNRTPILTNRNAVCECTNTNIYTHKHTHSLCRNRIYMLVENRNKDSKIQSLPPQNTLAVSVSPIRSILHLITIYIRHGKHTQTHEHPQAHG